MFAGLCKVLAAFIATLGLSVSAAEAEIKIVAFGDSLTAGYQLPPEAAFPVQLQKALRARYPGIVVVNAGVSGDTSKSGLNRLDWTLDADTDAVILELGANDALRGINPAFTEQALDGILRALAARKIEILIAGMIAPPNYGDEYAAAFNPIYSRLAKKYDALLYPFFLDGVAADPALNLPDGIHPTAEGIAVIVDNILPAVEELIARTKAQ